MSKSASSNLRLEGALKLEDGAGSFWESVGVGRGLGFVLGDAGGVGEGPVVEAGGYVGQGVAEVSGVDEVAVEHGVVADACDLQVGGLQGAEDRLEVVDDLGELRVGEGVADGGGKVAVEIE